jgi:hypothetical protein
MKKQNQTLNRFEQELESAVNGFNQEVKRLIATYQKSLPIRGVMTNFVISPRFVNPAGHTVLLTEPEVEEFDDFDVELDVDNLDLANLDEEFNTDDDDDIEVSEEDLLETAIPIEVDVKLLNSNADVILGYKKSGTNSVLFAPHYLLH